MDLPRVVTTILIWCSLDHHHHPRSSFWLSDRRHPQSPPLYHGWHRPQCPEWRPRLLAALWILQDQDSSPRRTILHLPPSRQVLLLQGVKGLLLFWHQSDRGPVRRVGQVFGQYQGVRWAQPSVGELSLNCSVRRATMVGQEEVDSSKDLKFILYLWDNDLWKIFSLVCSPRWPFAQTMWRIEFPFSSRISATAVTPCFTTSDWTSSRSPYLAASRRSSLSSSVSGGDMMAVLRKIHMAKSKFKFSLLPHDQIDLVWEFSILNQEPSESDNESLRISVLDVISSFWNPR